MKKYLTLLCILFPPCAMAISSEDCPKSYFDIPVASNATVDDPILQKVIAGKYDSIGFFEEGLAEVKKDCKYGFINEKGEEIVTLKFD